MQDTSLTSSPRGRRLQQLLLAQTLLLQAAQKCLRGSKRADERDSDEPPALSGLSWKMICRCSNWLALHPDRASIWQAHYLRGSSASHEGCVLESPEIYCSDIKGLSSVPGAPQAKATSSLTQEPNGSRLSRLQLFAQEGEARRAKAPQGDAGRKGGEKVVPFNSNWDVFSGTFLSFQ